MNTYYGYARVSTQGQSDNSIEEQLEYLEMEAQKVGCPFKPVFEKASAKSVDGRDALLGIIAELEDGDIVGFKYNDRYGRDTAEDLNLLKLFNRKNVKVHIDGKFVDIENPTDELTFTIMSAVATHERKLKKIKSIIGIKKKKEKGDWIFTGRLFGYRVVSRNGRDEVEIVEREAKILRDIFEEYAKGRSLRSIVKELNEKGERTREGKSFVEATVRRWILKPIYKGYYLIIGAGNKKGQEKILDYAELDLVKSKIYKPIVSEELWNSANRSYRTVHRTHSKQFEYKYAYYELGGILQCYHCEKTFGEIIRYVHSYWKSYGRYKAHGNYVHKTSNKNSKCGQQFFTFRAEVLERLFRTCYYLLFANPNELLHYFEEKEKAFDQKNEDVQEDVKRLTKELKAVQRKLYKITDLWLEENADNDSLSKQSEKLKGEKEELNRLIEEKQYVLNHQKEDLETEFEIFQEGRLQHFVSIDDPSERRKIYAETIESAYVVNGQIKIEFKNSKTFIIPLRKNRGRTIQREFEIEVHFDRKHQYDLYLDTQENDLKYIRKPIDRGLGERARIFKVAAEQKNENMIDDLKRRIKFSVSEESA